MKIIKRFLTLSIICVVLLAPQIFAAYGGAPNSGSGNVVAAAAAPASPSSGGGGGGGGSASLTPVVSCNECTTLGKLQCISGSTEQYKECILFNSCNIWSAVKFAPEGKSCVNNLIVNAVPVSATPAKKTSTAPSTTVATTPASQAASTAVTTPAQSTTGTKAKQDAKSGVLTGSMLLYTLIAIIGVTIIALVWEWHEKRR